MKASQLKKLISKVPDELEIEVHLDMLDDEEPIVGTVKSVQIALSVEKESVLVIGAEDASPDEEDEEEAEEGDDDEEGEEGDET